MHAEGSPRRRGPVPRISAEKIAEAVLDLGFDQAALTAVAQQLDVAHGALYRYIGDRNGMMTTAMTLAVERFEWPALGEDWREVIWNEARTWWAFCEQHPGFADVLATTPGIPVPMTRRSMNVAMHLRGLGVGNRDALMAVDFLSGTIHNIYFKRAQRESVLDQISEMPPELAELAASLPPDMLEVIVEGFVDDPWPWFAQKLQLVIDGIGSHQVSPDAPN